VGNLRVTYLCLTGNLKLPNGNLPVSYQRPQH